MRFAISISDLDKGGRHTYVQFVLMFVFIIDRSYFEFCDVPVVAVSCFTLHFVESFFGRLGLLDDGQNGMPGRPLPSRVLDWTALHQS